MDGDRVVIVGNALIDVTRDLLAGSPSEAGDHSLEVTGLVAELRLDLPKLIRDANKLYPGFLDKPGAVQLLIP